MKSLRIIFLGLIVITLAGCGAMMQDVMADCDRGQDFNAYAKCVKSTYNQTGNRPDATAVKAFYSHLDSISEAYVAKQITNAQAKSYAYDAFMKTVQAGNDRTDAAFMNYMGNVQQQQQQTRPIKTNCVKNGIYTNCTSY